MNIFHVIILSLIEGLTEFLPVSSTGHMVVASAMMGIAADDFVKLFEVFIQLGAILAVVVLYFKRFFRSIDLYVKLVIAVLPAVVMGTLLKHHIDVLLESPLVVAASLIVGGVILLFVDKWFRNPTVTEEKDVGHLSAFKIGLYQCLAMVPGVSRSAASIVGGMSLGLNRKAATEFSFLLAVPTMCGATLKELYDFYKHKSFSTEQLHDQFSLLLIGSAIAFVVALLAIKTFVHYIERRGFRVFGWYRIAAGSVIIALFLVGKMSA